MKIKGYCENCKYCERRVWTQKHYPADYHPIGISHAYSFCLNANKRCLEVKKNECRYEKKQ